MRWTPGGVSDDVEDRRGDSGGGGFGGFGGFRLGLGGFIIVGILSLLFHRNLFVFFSGAPSQTTRAPRQQERFQNPAEQRQVQFVSWVLDDVQRTWQRILPNSANVPYRRARLVLFRDVIRSGCGQAESETGPFYCPADEKVYLDLGFFNELRSRFGAPGEFAEAYVIAHEIGHHVQDLLGIERSVRRLQQSRPEARNQLSVRLELQADCLAGIWGNSTQQRNILERGDVESGLQAAAAVGDDRLQRSATGRVNPESFTHGTSAQRVQWFRRGFETGQVSACAELTSFRRPPER